MMLLRPSRVEEAGQEKINYFSRRENKKKKFLRTNKEVTGQLKNTNFRKGNREISAKQMQLLMYFSFSHCL